MSERIKKSVAIKKTLKGGIHSHSLPSLSPIYGSTDLAKSIKKKRILYIYIIQKLNKHSYNTIIL